MKLNRKTVMAALLAVVLSLGLLGGCAPSEKPNEEQPQAQKETVENQTITVAIGDVERGGVYTGEVVDGKPEGMGRFDSQNSLGEGWYYEGMWKDGQFNGEGKCVWENGQIKEGVYENGVWTPTAYGFYEYLFSLTEYGIDTNAKAFMDENSDLFSAQSDEKVKEMVDTTLEVEAIKETPENYGDKLLAIPNAYVAQVEQMTLEDTGDAYTYMIVVDDNEEIYEFYFIGALNQEIKASDTVTNIYGLPLGKSYYANVSGGVSKSLAVAGSYIEK